MEKAINAKTLTVTFTQPVDTSKANLEVVKSTIKQNVSKATWAADGKSATLELSTKLTKGEYTVNVTGLTDEKLSASVTVQDEMVDSIEILSDIAVLSSDKQTATVAYQVKNQYGEDITKTTSLTTNSGNVKVNQTTGLITLDGTAVTAGKEGDKIAIALVHPESAKSAIKTVTLSATAAASDVAITGLYNKDGKTLNEDTVLGTDEFYLLVDVKDQYGNAITNKTLAASGLIKSETNPTVIQTEGAGNSVTLSEVNVNGEKKLGMKLSNLQKAGESQVTLISTTTGKNASYKINVLESTRTDVVNVSAPALAVAKEDILVPVSVLDKQGQSITDVKVLNNGTKGVKVTFGTTPISNPFVKADDGNLYIKVLEADNQTDGTIPLVAQSSTFKVATQTIKVEKEAVPTTIRGLKKPLTLVAGSAAKTIGHADLSVEDQYGREMKSADVASYLTSGVEIRVKEDTTSDIVTLTADKISGPSTKASVKAGAKNGTETLSFVIFDGTKELAASTAEATVRVTDGTEYKSYEVSTVGTVYDEVGAGKTDNDVYDAEVEVFGLLADGSKVKLDNGTDFTVSSTNAQLQADVSTDAVIDATAAYTYADGETTVKHPLTVTINSTGEKFNQDVTFSKVAPKASEITIVENGTAAGYIAGTSNKVLSKFDFAGTAPFTLATLLNNADVVVTDQYGAQVELTATDGTVTFADGVTPYTNGTQIATQAATTLTLTKVAGNVAFAANGTNGASVTEMTTDSAFNAVLALGAVNAAPVKVTVTGAGYSANQVAATAEAGRVAGTLSVANGATTLPTVAAGYTIKVKTTSDAAKYDLNGKGLAAGTSNVVYTVTHTASGKTADTTPVVVTVTP